MSEQQWEPKVQQGQQEQQQQQQQLERPLSTREKASKISPFLKAQLKATGVVEALVVLRDGGLAASADHATGVARALRDAFVIDAGSPSQMMLRGARPTAKQRHNLQRAGVVAIESDAGLAAATGGAPLANVYPALGVMIGDVRADGLMQLAADERVEYVGSGVGFSLVRPRRAASSKLATTTTWGIDMLGVPQFWAAGLDGTGVLVGHLDTGADGTHPALKGAIKQFLFVDEAGFPGGGGTAYDTDTHGTHTAATIAGRPVSGRRVGVAPGAKLAVATVIEGGDATKRIITGLNWAVTNGVRIISLSLGFRGYVDDLYTIMKRVRERGVLPVVASGNEGAGTSRSPGNYDLVLSVGACEETRKVWRWSSSQRFDRENDPIVPDVVAPGVGVVSAAAGGGWMEMDGTSMATPHIAGLAALLWQAKPEASAGEIEKVIFDSASLGSMSEERAGRGLPNGPKAYELLTGQSLPAAPKKKAAKKKAAKKKPNKKKGAKKKASKKKAARKKSAAKHTKTRRKSAAGKK